jgi:hypothetical protein
MFGGTGSPTTMTSALSLIAIRTVSFTSTSMGFESTTFSGLGATPPALTANPVRFMP